MDVCSNTERLSLTASVTKIESKPCSVYDLKHLISTLDLGVGDRGPILKCVKRVCLYRCMVYSCRPSTCRLWSTPSCRLSRQSSAQMCSTRMRGRRASMSSPVESRDRNRP